MGNLGLLEHIPSLVPRFSDLFNTHKKGKRAWDLCDVGPYTRVGRVADRENCAWANTIFECSGLLRVKRLH